MRISARVRTCSICFRSSSALISSDFSISSRTTRASIRSGTCVVLVKGPVGPGEGRAGGSTSGGAVPAAAAIALDVSAVTATASLSLRATPLCVCVCVCHKIDSREPSTGLIHTSINSNTHTVLLYWRRFDGCPCKKSRVLGLTKAKHTCTQSKRASKSTGSLENIRFFFRYLHISRKGQAYPGCFSPLTIEFLHHGLLRSGLFQRRWSGCGCREGITAICASTLVFFSVKERRRWLGFPSV